MTKSTKPMTFFEALTTPTLQILQEAMIETTRQDTHVSPSQRDTRGEET